MTVEEQKAEKYAHEHYIRQHGSIAYRKSVEDVWLDGYHEGFNDCAKARLNVTTISDCPIKDDWHYVKDGEYPKNEKDVAVLYRDCDKINIYNCIYDIHAENWLYYNLDDMMLELFPYSVIAWKEITPPKEIE